MTRSKDDYKNLTTKEKLDLLDVIGDDLPDGAYFALAEEIGVDWDEVSKDLREEED